MLMAMKGSGGQFSVQVPGVDALRRLITEPARLAGLKYEERDGKTLDSVILDDASQHLELLPLLEYLLLELFRARTRDNVLTFAAYENFAAYTQDGMKLGGIGAPLPNGRGNLPPGQSQRGCLCLGYEFSHHYRRRGRGKRCPPHRPPR